ncbi:GAF domain-containing sensor histidine kinase [Undibacterium sp. SXout7W]|uniref:GAF domain-containing sensor histidine kinase n=1 Tax=Undibacterium sp. SXout7W TaxID=3413049 RepID=UPI003BF22DCA
MNSRLERILTIARRHPQLAMLLLRQSDLPFIQSSAPSDAQTLLDALRHSLHDIPDVLHVLDVANAALPATPFKALLGLSVSRILEEGTQAEVLQHLVDAALDVLSIDCSAIWLLPAGSSRLYCQSINGHAVSPDCPTMAPDVQASLLACFDDERGILIADDLAQYPLQQLGTVAFQQPQQQVCSLMGIPLRIQGRLAGVLFSGTTHRQRNWSFQDQVGGRYIAYLIQQILLRDMHTSLQHVLEEQVERRTAELQQQKQQLEEAQRNISMLSEIGREITSSLDRAVIMEVVYRHVHKLMGAEVFAVGLYRPEQQIIDFPCNIMRGEHMQPYTRNIHDSNLLSVWCITHQQEIFINNIEDEYPQYMDAAGLATLTVDSAYPDGKASIFPLSHIYVPMVIKQRTTGLIAIQSTKKNAFQRMHLDMAMTLAAYTAIAVDNADTYQQLANAQQILISQEKLAALGSLVAGIAHELNTPIGNSLLTASTLNEESHSFMQKMSANSLRRSDLNSFASVVNEANELLMRNLTNACDLVSSFKQVSVDQTSQQRRVFPLAQTTHEVVRTLHNKIHKLGHSLIIDIPEDIVMDSYPGPYGQIVTNLIQNAMLHGFENMSHGEMQIGAKKIMNDRVQVIFVDNGCGIPPENLRRIFDPFFTTKLGRGGSGLGLSIVHTLVSSIMGGKIDVQSTPGKGCRFTLLLPIKV